MVEKKNNMEFFNEHESHESHEFNKREGLREEERKLATPIKVRGRNKERR